MTLEKAELKQAFARSMGDQFDARVKLLEAEVYRLEGASGALFQAVDKLENLKTYWRKDAEEDKITHDVLTAAIKTIDQCEGALRNLAETAKVHKYIKQGEVGSMRYSVETCRKVITEEAAKAQALLASLEAAEAAPEGAEVPEEGGSAATVMRLRRPSGAHPGQNLAQHRRAKEAKEAQDVNEQNT